MELTGEPVSKVRRWIDDNAIIGMKVGKPKEYRVPPDFFMDGQPVQHLRGTITVLSDVGFSPEEVITWLHEENESLPGRPIDHLRQGAKSEVRRLAQALL